MGWISGMKATLICVICTNYKDWCDVWQSKPQADNTLLQEINAT